MSRTARLALLTLLLLTALPTRAAPKGWWDRDFTCRKRVVLRKIQRFKGSPAAHVRLSTGGHAKVDGSDIRVVSRKGRVVPSRIVARGPGDLFEVAFPAGGEEQWHVYYGNPDAEPPDEAYDPKRGLVLETRSRGAGTPNDWAGMQKILERSTAIHGGSYWPRIFDAENPFGPSDNFVSDYHGWIFCPRDGRYTFYTASDEASFLFVAGKLVAQWPGWHRAHKGAWGNFKGVIELKGGMHPFRYVHVERVGAQVMAAYWKLPGDAKARPIPEGAFPGPLDVDVVEYEVLGKDVAADFTAEVTHKWGLDNRVFSGVALKAHLMPVGSTYAWKFGDGVEGEGPIAFHVFLEGGHYDVTLTVTSGRESDTVTRTINVPDQWTRFDRNRPATLARFARIAATYPAERLEPTRFASLIFLLDEAGLADGVIAALRAAVDRNPLLTEKERFTAATRLGEIYRDEKRDLPGAVWAFQRAGLRAKWKFRMEAQVSVAGASLELGGDPRAALKLLEQAIREMEERGKATLRAYLRRGDALMILGEGGKARADYEEAAELAGGPESAKRLLVKAAATRIAMTAIEGKRVEQAFENLRKWERNAPEDRYTGLHRIAKAKALLLVPDADAAVRELTALLSGNPESEYADQALFLLAGIERDRGNDAGSAAYLERLRKEYPWSPLVK
jgi:tetratricopeptide (TPR) repeat protein